MPSDHQRPAEDDWSVRFADRAMERPESVQRGEPRPVSRKEPEKAREQEEAPEAPVSYVDVLIVMLVLELVFLPIVWLQGSDVYLVLVYAIVFTLIPLAIILAVGSLLARVRR